MRTSLLLAPLLLLLACDDKDEGRGVGGQVAGSGQGATGGQVASAGQGATGGQVASAGQGATGGQIASAGQGASGDGGISAGGTSNASGGMDSGGMAGQGTGGRPLVSCDLRKVGCDAAQPSCPENQVPSVKGSCFGPCVPIESCACTAADECPLTDRYTCWQKTHCGPYVH